MSKTSITFLVIIGIILQGLVFFVGMVVGYNLDRPEREKVEQSAVVEEKNQTDIKSTQGDGNEKQGNSKVAEETEVRPVSPEFEESSPAADKPSLSKPK